MQLILNSDIDTSIQTKMSTIEQKSLDQKFDHAALIENLISDYEGPKSSPSRNNSTEEPSDTCNDMQNKNDNDEIADDKEVSTEGEVSKDSNEEEKDTEQNDSQNVEELEPTQEQNIENKEVEVTNIESEEKENIEDNASETHDIEDGQSDKEIDTSVVQSEKVPDLVAVEHTEKHDTMEVLTEKEDTIEVDPPHIVRDCDKEVSEVKDTDTKSDDESSHVNTVNEEVINISDEKEEGVDASEKQNAFQESDNSEEDNKLNESDKSNNSITEEQDKIDKHISNVNNSNNLNTKDVGNISQIPEKRLSTENITEEKKKLTHICKLSNTLDILSDEEDEVPEKVEEKESHETVGDDKLFIDSDDDDIMLVDDVTTIAKDAVEDKHDITDEGENIDDNCKEENKINVNQDIQTVPKQEVTLEKNIENIINAETKVSEIKKEPKVAAISPKPLLPTNFLKTYKKNLSEMTRNELEQFCIMKIVEGVVDRSNLSEIKTQLKTMAQNLDEYKKRTQMISKQNRDLQVVLKSVQEEQKKRPDHIINPLKITRSVGMQVLMTDKCATKRKSGSGPNNSKQTKCQIVNSKKAQIIPVPRLVPAVNNSNVSNKSPAKQNTSTFLSGVSVKSSPPMQKSEKRVYSKMQQNNPDTVDLTDDEPPTKQPHRNVNAPVRLVPPQNLMATPRQAFSSNINSPRKVYIPISGSQTQNVRPGQTFMLKAISPQQAPRQRMTSSLMCKQPPNIRMSRQLPKHPAPLPESTKQFELPNWKSLPPAPELKLSKVENGIVISWKIDGFIEENYEEIASFQLYAYQETTSPPNTALWKKIGDVKALPLPMACTLTQFMAGYKYYFAVRAIDVRSRVGPFSEPSSILLLNKM